MNELEAYSIFQGIKLHFTSKTYDYFKYSGKVSISVEKFEKRRDRWVFKKLAKKYNKQELETFILANILKTPKIWSMGLLSGDAEATYLDYLKYTEALEHNIKREIKYLEDESEKLEIPVYTFFQSQSGDMPEIIKYYRKGKISLDFIILICIIVRLESIWDTKIKDDIIWPEFHTTITKYKPFLRRALELDQGPRQTMVAWIKSLPKTRS